MVETLLLKNKTAIALYNDFAKDLPIIDYHCHINPEEVAKNRKFNNLTEIWLEADHYKWRLMRTNGVNEKYITGEGKPREKFQHFAEMLPKAAGNPMYHWAHLELKRYFDFDGSLCADTAEDVWKQCNQLIADDSMSVRGIIKKSKVELIGTTDDPADKLDWHRKIREDTSFKTAVIPSFRPDRILCIERVDFQEYVVKLGHISNVQINSIDDVFAALATRIDYFKALGCKLADHGLDYIPFNMATDRELGDIFKKRMQHETLCADEVEKYKTSMLIWLGRQYANHDIVMQLHYGVIRNANTHMFNNIGADTGFDCMSGHCCATSLIGLLNTLNRTNQLPRTVIYSLNPADNEIIGSVIGAFQCDTLPGKIQHGSAWWFNDNKDGIENQLKSLANLSLLGTSIGMLTDSRSFLSYTRHEYFRRILCNLIGTWMEDGEYTSDINVAGKLVQDICYNNIKAYLGL